MSGETCPDCGSKFYCHGRCIVCAMGRMFEQRRQMSERSAPQYDLLLLLELASGFGEVVIAGV